MTSVLEGHGYRGSINTRKRFLCVFGKVMNGNELAGLSLLQIC